MVTSLRSAFFLAASFLFLAGLIYSFGCAGSDDDDGGGDDASVADDTADDDTVAADWVWTPVDGAVCRDGTGTGFVLHRNEASQNVMIFLQGGGACYSADSCGDNPSHFDEADVEAWAAGDGKAGIFDFTKTENPVRDWNIVFVPYCTGDLHTGSMVDGDAPGVAEKQQFVGYQNMNKNLPQIKSLFPSPSRVFLAGESAGGFGTIVNYPHVARAFEGVPVSLLDDSGPLFPTGDVLSACLQLLVSFVWDLSPAIADGCADCMDAGGAGFAGWHPYMAEQWPQGTFGLFSSMEDATIRDFFGIGQNDCTGTEPIPAATYTQGLLDMRDNLLLPTGKWSTYFIPGDTHTILPYEDAFYSTEIGGVALTNWVGDLTSSVPAPVGP